MKNLENHQLPSEFLHMQPMVLQALVQRLRIRECSRRQMSSDPDFLHIIDVYKVYNGKVILDNIDLQVSRGEFCTVVGPSGCGKSTLLRLIIGAEVPTAGQILLEHKIVGPPDIHRGVVFQKYSLFPHLTVLDNISLGLRLGGRQGSKEMGAALLF
ncbi:MAG: ATP-binding cassette domain-containing protein [Candidatus Electrothrix scaldis]|nr:MAG: ATP-binding cassette domain-containing protein [Candidatus Electrothrix sp. GW3-3]